MCSFQGETPRWRCGRGGETAHLSPNQRLPPTRLARPTCPVATHPLSANSLLISLPTHRDIDAGEELTITYTDSSLATDVRRQHLLQGYGFLCQCPLCTEGS